MKLFISTIILIFVLGIQVHANAAFSILNNSGHYASIISSTLAGILGAGVVDTSIFVDAENCSTSFDANFNSSMVNTTQSNYQASLGSCTVPVNHSPYALGSVPFTDYSITVDLEYYSQNIQNGVLINWGYTSPTVAIGTPPPITYTTVQNPYNSGYTGWGIEFGQSNGYLGYCAGDTSPSCATGEFTAILAAMKYNHTTWTWQDVKGALRQTASNWVTGYDPANFGYGVINYTSANAISNTANIYLQPPIMTITPTSQHESADVTIYPYRQTRRNHEVIYQFNSAPTFSSVNELTPSVLSALGGKLVYISNGTDLIPTIRLTFTSTGTFYFVAFTVDVSGNASRIESFSSIVVSTVIDECS